MDIRFVLKKINSGDIQFFIDLTDEQLKEISPYVLTMWCAGATDNTELHTLMTDIHINDLIFPLGKHPRLLLAILAGANGGFGHNDRYRFKSMKSAPSGEKVIKYLMRSCGCNRDTALEYRDLLSKDDIKEIERVLEEN